MKIFRTFLVSVLVIATAMVFVACGEPATAQALGNSVERNTDRLIRVLENLDSVTNKDLDIKDISPINAGTVSNTRLTGRSGDSANVVFGRNTSTATRNSGSTSRLRSRRSTATARNTRTQRGTYLPERVGYLDDNGSVIKDINYGGKKINESIINDQNVINNPTVNSGNGFTDGRINQDNTSTNQNNGIFSYQPRYVNSVSQNFNTNNLDSYFQRIQELYQYCSDCISTNAQCNTAKDELGVCVNQCKSLCDQLKDGTITLSDDQINQCNDCIKDLNDCISKINSTKGDLNSLIARLKPYLSNYSGNISSICDCYSQITRCLDTRIDEINNCTSCVTEINDIICNSNITDGTVNPTTNVKRTVDNTNISGRNVSRNNTTGTTGQNTTVRNPNQNTNVNRNTNTTPITNPNNKTSDSGQNYPMRNPNTIVNPASPRNVDRTRATPSYTTNRTRPVGPRVNNPNVQRGIVGGNTNGVEDPINNGVTADYLQNPNNTPRVNQGMTNTQNGNPTINGNAGRIRNSDIVNNNQMKGGQNSVNQNSASNGRINNQGQNIQPQQTALPNQPVNIAPSAPITTPPTINSNMGGVPPNNLQQQNAMNNNINQPLGNTANGFGIMGGMNGNPPINNMGYNGFGGNFANGYGTGRNIDTYATLPRNIDTYQNIYTNIDTYGRGYIPNNNANGVNNGGNNAQDGVNGNQNNGTVISPKAQDQNIGQPTETNNFNQAPAPVQQNNSNQSMITATDNNVSALPETVLPAGDVKNSQPNQSTVPTVFETQSNNQAVIETQNNNPKLNDTITDTVHRENTSLQKTELVGSEGGNTAIVNAEIDNIIKTENKNSTEKVDAPAGEIISVPVQKEIPKTEVQVDAPVITSPLPNPFDPEKMEEKALERQGQNKEIAETPEHKESGE